MWWRNKKSKSKKSKSKKSKSKKSKSKKSKLNIFLDQNSKVVNILSLLYAKFWNIEIY